MHLRLASPFLLLLAFGCDSGHGNDMSRTFQVTLSADQENPRCPDAGPTATGSATVVVGATDVEVSNFTWSGLSGLATAAHIHLGMRGVSGSIVLSFALNPAPGIAKTFVASDYPNPPMADQPASFSALLPVISGGGTYLNVHTSSCSGGEIRGQIGP
jgi:CHRD domain